MMHQLRHGNSMSGGTACPTRALLRVMLACVCVWAGSLGIAQAQAYNALEECMNASSDNNDVHNCLDNYLDLMDDNIDDLAAYIERELDGAAVTAFTSSQQSFVDYRRLNCLWYLEFSSPREQAELIAKNCLASMSQQRLSELQSLIASNARSNAQSLSGFYVYGPNRNSFRPCGTSDRYWVEGDNSAVSQLQQNYLEQATTDLQVMYADLKGELDDNTQSYVGHKGVVVLESLVAVRVPQESDCELPGGVASVTTSSSSTLATLPQDVDTDASDESADSLQEDDAPQQSLRAYFGEWQADCTQRDANFECLLSVDFTSSTAREGDALPGLRVTRRPRERTLVQVRFPDREIDSTSRIRWRIDNLVIGDIIGSDIRVDETATRQLIHERKFIRDDLIPMMLKGSEVRVEVVESPDDVSGERFNATLFGLTRALAFADDFIESGGQL